MAFPAICYEHRHFNDIKDGRGDVHEEGRRWAEEGGGGDRGQGRPPQKAGAGGGVAGCRVIADLL